MVPWGFYHIYPSILIPLDSPHLGAQADMVTKKEPSSSILIFSINVLRLKPSELPGQPASPALTPCPHLSLFLCY